MNHRALYRHFPSKDSLVTAVASEGFRQLAAELARAGDAREFLHRFTRFVVHRARLYELMTSPGGRPAITPRAHASPAGQVIAHSLRVLGRPRSGDAARDTVFRVWGVVHGLAMLYGAGLLRARSREAAIAYIANAAHETLGGPAGSLTRPGTPDQAPGSPRGRR